MFANRTESRQRERAERDGECDLAGGAESPSGSTALNKKMDREDGETEQPRGKTPRFHRGWRRCRPSKRRSPHADDDVGDAREEDRAHAPPWNASAIRQPVGAKCASEPRFFIGHHAKVDQDSHVHRISREAVEPDRDKMGRRRPRRERAAAGARSHGTRNATTAGNARKAATARQNRSEVRGTGSPAVAHEQLRDTHDEQRSKDRETQQAAIRDVSERDHQTDPP